MDENSKNEKTKNKNIKKIFFITNNEEDIALSAGGVIFYKITDGELFLLLSYSREKYEDLGGRCDINDKDIFDTIAREVEEESNKLILRDAVLKRIKNNSKYAICKQSKYMVHFIKANCSEMKLSTEDFGKVEFHENLPRTIHWLNVKDVLKEMDKFNFRLRNNNVISLINRINPKGKKSLSTIIYMF